MDLCEAIRAHLSEWQTPLVEPVIFGVSDPPAVADALRDASRSVLQAEISGCLFYRSSIGAVAGLSLTDGRTVVLKAHQPRVSIPRLTAVHGVMAHLAKSGFPCPTPLAPPAPFARGAVTFESHQARGVRRDAHEPVVRRELARRLADLVRLAQSAEVDRDALGRAWFSGLTPERLDSMRVASASLRRSPARPGRASLAPTGLLWPRPHSALFDFEATAGGAEWIDAWARQARRVPLAGKRVVGHFDWRTEHARFEGDRLVAAYDWDSLHFESEPVMVGACAHAFTADWEDDAVVPAPSVDEVQAFVADYEDARGKAFSSEERRALHASCVYSIAYTARCGHAIDPTAGTARDAAFAELLRAAGPVLLGDSAE